ncbi:hypothetical protein EV702DRAFT_1199060 [Suillus placidus]|uniref:Uncharacterized protein n=1 Tax=Suillus placidus TaxID=48579 RepID=A0A9P7D0E3_9AGAM|nr:hypothetical protein EV702DRAFT_1199060 [Suillus placidus]
MPVDANEPDTNEQNTNCFQAILRSLDGATNINSNVLDPYLSSARFFRLNYDLFAHFDMVLWEGIQAQFDPDWIDPDQDQSKEAQAIREHHLQVYQKFSSSIPNWRSLKHNRLQYLLKDPAKDHFDPPILKTHGKAVWGWNHTATARLLCPARDILEFNEDPHTYMDRVKSGQKQITSKQWLSMFYDMSLYNPRNKKLVFLRCHAIVQGWHHIFTGPMSALSKECTHHSSKPAKGKKHHLMEPGPRNIMYAAIQMYFVACNAESWTPEVSTMNLDDLYYTAVDLLEMHADEQWKESVVLFFVAVNFIDCSSELPGLMQGHPLKHQRVAANSTVSDSEDNMDDFFGNDSEEMQGVSGRDRSTTDRESESNTGNTTGPSSAAAAESNLTCGTAAAGTSSMDGAAGQGQQAGSTDMQLGGLNSNGNNDDEDDDDGQPWRRRRLNQQVIQREHSPLTPPPTSPTVTPTATRGRGRGPSNHHGRGKHGGKH